VSEVHLGGSDHHVPHPGPGEGLTGGECEEHEGGSDHHVPQLGTGGGLAGGE
jgi:hypothetical protein